MYLFEVKKPEESKEHWDYYKQLATIPGDEAFSSLAESGCRSRSEVAAKRGPDARSQRPTCISPTKQAAHGRYRDRS